MGIRGKCRSVKGCRELYRSCLLGGKGKTCIHVCGDDPAAWWFLFRCVKYVEYFVGGRMKVAGFQDDCSGENGLHFRQIVYFVSMC